MEQSKHVKVEMIKLHKYKILYVKYIETHRLKNMCKCSEIVTNLLGGERIWTRIQFDCGEIIKINCGCLKLC
jgi:hypothetical protein